MNLKDKCRRSVRLKGFDYSSPGGYYITICTHQHRCILGEIIKDEMIPNRFGKIAHQEWLKTAQIRTNVIIGKFIVMPNHIHGIIILDTDHRRGTVHRAPTYEQFGKSTSSTIPTIIRSFKSTVTKQCNIILDMPEQPFWQRGYYEHVIRGEKDLLLIQEYVTNNPLKIASG